jgi:quercetin dioxygenase-like cupin family protein
VTLAAASQRTGISVSTLSRLESGVRAPTLDLLLPLARAYRVAIGQLIDAPPTGDPRIYPQPITRHGMTVIPLTNGPTGLQAFKNVLAAGPVGLEPQPRSHQGYHWLYVLDGRLRVVLGERDLVLSAGEAAEFDTHVPHWFGNAEPHAVEFLSVLSTSGQRIQLTVRPADFQ